VSTTLSLDRFITRYLAAGRPPPEPFDPDWRSPCECGAAFAGAAGGRYIHWQPVRREPPRDLPADQLFRGLEHALELTLHPDIKDYYGRYWSAGLDARAPDGPVGLILLWNPADFDRLAENLIGHALAKRRQRAPLTLFFAGTDPDSEYFLSVDNDGGQVLLELPGRRPVRVVADNLAVFLDSLEPHATGPDPV
jgi:SecY interacting protein Syd